MQVWANNSAWESMFQGSGEVKNEQKVKGHGRRGLKPQNNFLWANSKRKCDKHVA